MDIRRQFPDMEDFTLELIYQDELEDILFEWRKAPNLPLYKPALGILITYCEASEVMLNIRIGIR